MSIRIACIALALTLALCSVPGISQTTSAPTVTLRAGKLSGAITASGEAVFKNIPFAQPPIGDLRWHEPLPAKPWPGVRDATAFSPACVQSGNEGATSSEDCLYLNVWTPAWPMPAQHSAAVMLWIYGGGNFAGATSDPTFNGESLARHGVILVTANYRLGVFGFFAHPELTRASPHHSSGNYGLLDQIAALQWVHDNIAKFGGDPGDVTIFGESAGSLDINVLMASPLSKGLFQRVIGESGPVIAPPPLSDGEKKGVDLAAKLNAPTLAELRALPATTLQAATGQGLAYLGANLGVTVDGWVFPESPMKVFAEGREHKVGLLIGSNSQELQKPFFPMPGGDLRSSIAQQYGPLAPRALAAYKLDSTTDPAPDPELGPVLAQWATDSQFRCGTEAELLWHTTAHNSGYQFQFSRPATGKESLGAPHGSEVPYVFGTLNNQRYNDTDRQVSQEMQIYWTNFAKTGNPNDIGADKNDASAEGLELPTWPAFTPATRAYIDLTSSGSVAKHDLQRPACDVYTDLLKSKLTP
ncbi:MAG TPA: carboxylesterase family protein [Acidobacteriaceae bacterium]|nr:carboxylesterase family protein [Acidobacteriaceae bacterium]